MTHAFNGTFLSFLILYKPYKYYIIIHLLLTASIQGKIILSWFILLRNIPIHFISLIVPKFYFYTILIFSWSLKIDYFWDFPPDSGFFLPIKIIIILWICKCFSVVLINKGPMRLGWFFCLSLPLKAKLKPVNTSRLRNQNLNVTNHKQ